MKVVIKKKELGTLLAVLDSLFSREMKSKASWAIMKNKKTVSSEVEDIKEHYSGIKKPEKFLEFDSKRIDILENYCMRSSDGKPVIVNQEYQFPTEEDNLLSKKEITKIKKEYEDGIKEMDEINKDFNASLEDEIEIDLHSVSVDLLPDMSPGEMEIIDIFIS